MGMMPARLTSPTVGLRPTIPVAEAGQTIEPSVSVPIATAQKLADTAAADPTLMDSLAKITELSGGKSLAPEELPDLIEQIKRKPPDLDVQTQVRETPWDTWPFFLMFAGLLCGEWYLRKKWGLV
jgi:hypothetical protein